MIKCCIPLHQKKSKIKRFFAPVPVPTRPAVNRGGVGGLSDPGIALVKISPRIPVRHYTYMYICEK